MIVIDSGIAVFEKLPLSAGTIDWWDLLGSGACVYSAYQPKGASSFAGSLVDLTGNGNDAIDPGGAGTPTWDAVNGWTFNGIANYLATTFTVQNDQSQSVVVQYTNNVATGNYLFGAKTGTDYFTISAFSGPRIAYGNGALLAVAPQLLSGNLGVAGNQGYRNGIANGGAIGAYSGAITHSCAIGALQTALGVFGNFQSVQIQAIAFYDCVLSSAQMAAAAAIMPLL